MSSSSSSFFFLLLLLLLCKDLSFEVERGGVLQLWPNNSQLWYVFSCYCLVWGRMGWWSVHSDVYLFACLLVEELYFQNLGIVICWVFVGWRLCFHGDEIHGVVCLKLGNGHERCFWGLFAFPPPREIVKFRKFRDSVILGNFESETYMLLIIIIIIIQVCV